MAKLKIKPLGDRVLVEPAEEAEVKKGGIIIPDSAKEKPHESKVIALGTGKTDDNGDKVPFEVSVGDIVLSGGEPAVLTLLDACVRLLLGVMGRAESAEEESFETGLLEYLHYTRPQDWKGRLVPDVLLSGHHENIRQWRRAQAEAVTKERRPDLWANYVQDKH